MISIKKRILHSHVFYAFIYKKLIILKSIFFETIQLYMKIITIISINLFKFRCLQYMKI